MDRVLTEALERLRSVQETSRTVTSQVDTLQQQGVVLVQQTEARTPPLQTRTEALRGALQVAQQQVAAAAEQDDTAQTALLQQVTDVEQRMLRTMNNLRERTQVLEDALRTATTAINRSREETAARLLSIRTRMTALLDASTEAVDGFDERLRSGFQPRIEKVRSNLEERQNGLDQQVRTTVMPSFQSSVRRVAEGLQKAADALEEQTRNTVRRAEEGAGAAQSELGTHATAELDTVSIRSREVADHILAVTQQIVEPTSALDQSRQIELEALPAVLRHTADLGRIPMELYEVMKQCRLVS